MAINNYSNDLNAVNVNGREIKDWGATDPPISEEELAPLSTLIKGNGGNAVSFDTVAPGRRVTLNVNPGSGDAFYLQGLANSKANITYGRAQVSTGEVVAGSEGKIVTKGTVGRGGPGITDFQIVIEFNIWSGTA